MLALLLAMGGAWAQGPTAAEINADLYSGWSSIDDELFKASELPGFQAVTEDQAKSWTGVPSTGVVKLYYEFVADGHVKYVSFQNGVYAGSYEENEFERFFIYEDIEYNGDIRYFYTTGSGAIKLTPDATGKVWTLDETPDYDLDLNVVYYQKYALKEIPANWQVKVDGVDKTAAIDGDSLKITETAQVLLTPDHPEYVKSVTLLDVAGPQTLIVAKGSTELSGNKELYYITGDTYRQALARPENQSGNDLGWGFWESSDLTTIYFKEVSDTPYDMAIDSDYNFATGMGTCAITLDSVIDPNHAFQFVAAQ